LVARRADVAGGSNVMVLPINSIITVGLSLKVGGTGTTLTLAADSGYVVGAGAVSFQDYLGYHGSSTYSSNTASQQMYITISGCAADTDLNAEYHVTTITHNVLTIAIATSPKSTSTGKFLSSDTSAGAGICKGNTITFKSRMGSLVDSKSVAVHDRIKVVQTTSTYETRTVDKIWGSNLDVTIFSVVDAYGASGSGVHDLQDMVAWVDEKGSTESLECSRRGLCDTESGTCECFQGYAGKSCDTQNALAV
jgi:hypothetical protein